VVAHRLGRLDHLGDEVGRADEVAALVGPADRVSGALPFGQAAQPLFNLHIAEQGHRAYSCQIEERTQTTGSLPTLWQIEISHYSEKARWALAFKQVEHERRAPVPGSHIPVALWLTRGAQTTFPVLSIDGRNIGDSTAILAALEERYPDPPLYPSDPEERRRALALEDFFDEGLGPHVRLLAFHELRNDPERFVALMERRAPEPLTRFPRAGAAYARA
jgi:hypothetical protein